MTDLDARLRPALLALVERKEWGDSMSPLRWTTKSTRKLAAELTEQGHRVSVDAVADLLREEGFSLRPTPRPLEALNTRIGTLSSATSTSRPGTPETRCSVWPPRRRS